MENRVGSEVQQHLPPKVDQAVSEHLGAFAAQSGGQAAAARRDAPPAQALLGELRSPGGIRRAIMLQEILQRPLALRRRRH
jgi:hypothetical protein